MYKKGKIELKRTEVLKRGLWLRSLLKEISVTNTLLESNVGSNNTAVKRWACAWGSILAGRAQISRAKFQRET